MSSYYIALAYLLQIILFVLALMLAWYEVNNLRSMIAGAPFIGTPHNDIKKMIEIAKLKPSDIVYELGCGDGRISLAAAQTGAAVIGIDINGYGIFVARQKARRLKLKNVTFIKTNINNHTYEDADVIFLYMLPKVMNRLESKLINQLKPGSRIIVKSFPFPNLKPKSHVGTIFEYII